MQNISKIDGRQKVGNKDISDFSGVFFFSVNDKTILKRDSTSCKNLKRLKLIIKHALRLFKLFLCLLFERFNPHKILLD